MVKVDSLERGISDDKEGNYEPPPLFGGDIQTVSEAPSKSCCNIHFFGCLFGSFVCEL